MGCQSDSIPSDMSNVTSIFSPARVINTNTSLMPNDKALFNATGGIIITNEIFTFDGTKWENENSSISANASEATTLTALYPAYNSNNNLITENPYSDNALEDILIAQCTFTNEIDIELCFKHLFSMLTIHVQSPLKESISSFSMTAPKVTNMQADGNFSTEGTHTTIPALNNTGDYTFIIPSVENCNLTLSFTIGEETISHNLTHTFKSGYKYECNITDREQVGINSAEELIAFTRLINNLSSNNFNLSDFGEEQEDGQMRYRLLKDIDFTGINTEDLLPICYNQDNPFNDIFDGGGHTIANLTINPSNAVTGIFGRIGSNGIVKDLHLNKCQTPVVSKSSSAGVGLIAASLSGLILNCSITEGNIIATEATYRTGAIAGNAYSGSNIINCYVKNTSISSYGYTGSIVGAIVDGVIINCFSATNALERKDNACGGFCGYAEESSITNCYNYNLDFANTDKTGMIIGIGKSSSINNHYSDSRTPVFIFEDNECTKEKYAFFSMETENISTILCNRLNQWIETNQSSYPYTFTQWQADKTSNLPAIFQ